jgi:hypothetical protein
VLVSDDGKNVVTFDNWHSVGFGDNVVVIYGPNGMLVKSFQLDQILPPYFISGFDSSVSSIFWRGEGTRLLENELYLVFEKPRSFKNQLPQLALTIGLETGQVGAITDDKLTAIKPHFCAAHKSDVSEFNAWLVFERNDLIAPTANNTDDWALRRYVHNAIKRLKPAAELSNDEPWSDEYDFELLMPGEYMEKGFRNDFRDALTMPDPELMRRWFFSKDQTLMTREIEKAAKKIKTNQLAGVDMRFFADSDHWPRIEKAMSLSGAILTQVDTGKPIPQTAEVLAKLPLDKHIDASCLN